MNQKLKLMDDSVDFVIIGEKSFKRWCVVKRAFKYLFLSVFGKQGAVDYLGVMFRLGSVHTAERLNELTGFDATRKIK